MKLEIKGQVTADCPESGQWDPAGGIPSGVRTHAPQKDKSGLQKEWSKHPQRPQGFHWKRLFSTRGSPEGTSSSPSAASGPTKSSDLKIRVIMLLNKIGPLQLLIFLFEKKKKTIN